MITVECQLPDGCVFLAGQTVSCLVKLSCCRSQDESSSGADSVENIAWISAQIQCFCQVNSLPAHRLTEVSDLSATSYRPERGERGRVMVDTAPCILACDVCLCGGETRSFSYRQKLADNIPPSYRGRHVSFTYKVTVGVQRVAQAVCVTRVPLRVLPVPARVPLAPAGDSVASVCPANPFMTQQRRQRDDSTAQPLTPHNNSAVSHLLHHSHSKRSPRVFNITNQRGRVVRLWLCREMFRLGDEVVALLDLTKCGVRCLEYAVSLQCVEQLRQPDTGPPGELPVKQPPCHVHSFCKNHDVCVDVERVSVSLRVPVHVTPSFSHQLVSVQWRLHFEFVTEQSASSPTITDTSDTADTWDAPDTVHVETMVWNLDIDVLSTSPRQVQHCSYSQLALQSHSLTV